MEQLIESFGNFVESWPYCEGTNIAEVLVGRGRSTVCFAVHFSHITSVLLEQSQISTLINLPKNQMSYVTEIYDIHTLFIYTECYPYFRSTGTRITLKFTFSFSTSRDWSNG